MDIQLGGTLGLNIMDGDTYIDWDKYFKQNFEKIDSFVGNMAKNWPVIGVAEGLQVTASTGMKVAITKGTAVVKGHFFTLDADTTLNIAAADTTKNRIDMVVLRLDWPTGIMTLSTIQGVAATVYSAPLLTTNDTKWEIPLAQVNVDAGVTSITAAKITEARLFVEDPSDLEHPITLQNGWTVYTGTPTATFYRTDTGRVYLSGMIKGGTMTFGTTLFTLPTSHRPKHMSYRTFIHEGGTGILSISTDGNVVLQATISSNTWLVLNEISFL
jgi:hypothetical protein